MSGGYLDAAMPILEDFDDGGHLLDCGNVHRQDPELCDCARQLLVVARATRAALERKPARLVVDVIPEALLGVPDGVVAAARRAFDVRPEVGDPDDPLILIRQLRAQLGAMTTPSAFGREPITGLHAFGRVLDQLQGYVLDWGRWALDNPQAVPPPRYDKPTSTPEEPTT